jgi:hypothetical protein
MCLPHAIAFVIEDKYTQGESTQREQLCASKQQRRRQFAEFTMPPLWKNQ